MPDELPRTGDILSFDGVLWSVREVKSNRCKLQLVRSCDGGRMFELEGSPRWFSAKTLRKRGWSLIQSFEYFSTQRG